MKTQTLIIGALTIIAISLHASHILPPYEKSKPPGIALPVAYERAQAALGSETNYFHCVSASITTEFTSEGEWNLTFYSTNSKAMPKHIIIKFDGKVILDNGLR